MTEDKRPRDLVADAIARAKKDRELCKDIGEDFQKEFGDHEGPIFGPRNDIERQRQIKEIKGSGDKDNE